MRLPYRIFGLRFFSRTSANELMLVSYHPRSSKCWHWAVTLADDRFQVASKAKVRRGQWHDYYALPFGRVLRVSRQDFHLGTKS